VLPCHGGRGVAHHPVALLRAARRRLGSAGRQETLVRDLDEPPSLQPRGGARTAERRGNCEAAQSVPATASPHSGPPPRRPRPAPPSARSAGRAARPLSARAADPAPRAPRPARRGSAYRRAEPASTTGGAGPIGGWGKGAGGSWRDGLAYAT